MQMFYSPFNEHDTQCKLDEGESGHLINVLRKKVGDTILLTNGKGLLYEASITLAHSKHTVLDIKKCIQKIDRQHPYFLHIAIAPTKNMDRLETFVEKACELGIDEITPIICERSERKEVKVERLMKIALSAMKQSGSLFLPRINEAVSLKQFIVKEEQLLVCTCEGERQAIASCDNASNTYCFLVGPEGDFSPTEIEWMRLKEDTKLISLGVKRLRTETAGIHIASFIYSKY